MNFLLLSLLAFIAGVAIAAQASLNAQLAVQLHNALLASITAFFSGLVFSLVSLISLNRSLPDLDTVIAIPNYLWFSGGLLSAFAITVFYWLIPKIGIAPVISLALCGQLFLALLAGHFGWFGLPVTQLSGTRVLGSLSLVLGIVLINLRE